MNKYAISRTAGCRLTVAISCCFLFFTGVIQPQAATAHMEIICFSPHVSGDDAEGGPFGLEYRMDFTTLENEANSEWELAPEDIPYTLATTMILYDPQLFDSHYLPCFLDLPPYEDANGDGVDDFYDLEMGVDNVTVEGAYFSPVSNGYQAFTAVWYRAPEALYGTLNIHLPDLNLRTSHSVSIWQFEGEFTYTPDGQNLPGTVSLVSWWDPGDVLTGPLNLTIQDPQTLGWQGGTWTSPYGYDFTFSPFSTFDLFDSVYLDYFTVNDGYTWTGGGDFQEWMAFLHADDSDGDGTPDLAESGGSVPVTRPTMAVIRVPTGIQITITGQSGVSYSLETCPTVDGTYNQLQVVDLSSTTGTVTLPDDDPQQYLRLRVL